MAASIICGVDDSESAKEAARVARALAAELRLGLLFVRVVGADAPDAQVSAIAERLERLSAGSTDVDCGAAWLVEAGQPADCLVSAATKAEAALIVVGSTGPRSSTVGSISADVSRRAPCPVVVVPPGAHACGADPPAAVRLAHDPQRLPVTTGVCPHRPPRQHSTGGCSNDRQHMLVSVRVDADHVVQLICKHPD